MIPATRFTRVLPDDRQTLLLKAAVCPLPHALDAWEQWKDLQHETLAGNPAKLPGRLKEKLDPCSFRLLPLVHQNLKNSGDMIAHLLRPIYLRTAQRNQQLLGFTKGIVGALEQEGIGVMLLKGIPLTFLYYEDPGVRLSADVDMLIAPGQFSLACKILERKMKFIPQIKVSSVFFRGIFHVMHSQVFRGDFPFELDVHHRLFHEHVRDSNIPVFFRKKRRTVLSGHFGADIPSPEHLLFHILSHARSPRPSIRWVADAVTICRKEPGIRWDEILELAEAYRFTSFFKVMLPFLYKHFEVPVPAEILTRLAEYLPPPLEERYFRILEEVPQHAWGKLYQFFYRDWLQQKQNAAGSVPLTSFILQQKNRIIYRIWESRKGK